jgi:hypothetical protein
MPATPTQEGSFFSSSTNVDPMAPEEPITNARKGLASIFKVKLNESLSCEFIQ